VASTAFPGQHQLTTACALSAVCPLRRRHIRTAQLALQQHRRQHAPRRPTARHGQSAGYAAHRSPRPSGLRRHPVPATRRGDQIRPAA
jgi:hypothetical protein